MDISLFVLLLCISNIPGCVGAGDQNALDEIGKAISVKVVSITNIDDDNTFTFQINLENNGQNAIQRGNWTIFFDMIRLIEPSTMRVAAQTTLNTYHIKINHLGGTFNSIELLQGFTGIQPGEVRTFNLTGEYWLVARGDVIPNWYLFQDGLNPVIIENTRGEGLQHVGNFDTPQQWKRYAADQYDPFTINRRYNHNDVQDTGRNVGHIIPTPMESGVDGGVTMLLTSYHWEIVAPDAFKSDAEYLSGIIDVPVTVNVTGKNLIKFVQVDNITIKGVVYMGQEVYGLVVDPANSIITIHAIGSPGAFYAAVTLSGLIDDNRKIPKAHIKDSPRFGFRGLSLDVARNFHTKGEVLRLLDIMSMYKMNKFHFHLSDDESWRLEIPGIEEMTTVGSKRCHSINMERDCLMPQVGSGPFDEAPGSGFYSVADYQEILRYAATRHIEVIPEFDMPAHCRAGIKSLEARYHSLMQAGMVAEAEQFLLTDFEDNTQYLSVQYFRDNVINPCIESTYRFIEHILIQVIGMHKNINPLKMYHFGGDESPPHTWVNSTACFNLTAGIGASATNDPNFLRKYFLNRISKLTSDNGVSLGGWEDAFLDRADSMPYNRSIFQNQNVYAYVWNVIWEWGGGKNAYVLANADYKVVLTPATHLYLDHSQEPDPHERGYYWATRFIDTQKVFSYIPSDIYANADVDRAGRPLDMDAICGADYSGCPPLDKPENIVGIQGSVWSEVIRNPSQLSAAVFPRLLAIAERAWHQASWENVTDKTTRRQEMLKDWESFANALGHKELLRLDRLGVDYHLTPPGAKLINGKLITNTPYPGLVVEVSSDDGNTWMPAEDAVVLPYQYIIMRSRSADMQRVSRSVSITIPPGLPSSANQKGMPVSVLFVAVLLMINDIIVNPL